MATQEELQLKQGETIEAYNTRVAALRGDTPEELASTQKAISEQSMATARASPISIPKTLTSEDLSPTSVPDLPEPTALSAQEAFNLSATATADRARATLEAANAQQLKDATARKDATKKEYDRINKLITDTIGKGDPTKEATYAQQLRILQNELDASEAASKTIQKNFEANQSLTDQLKGLLDEGNVLIEQQKRQAVPTVFAKANLNKTISDVTAQAATIQATLTARNGQINQAYNIIDKAAATVSAERTDRINYYNTLLEFYGRQKTEAEKFISLSADEKQYIEAQVKLLENDNVQAQANAEALKKALSDPDTALLYADAEITVNTTQSAIPGMLAKAGYLKEVRDLSNEKAKDGYTYLAPGQAAPAGYAVVTTTDSRGVQKRYVKKETGTDTLKTQDYINATKFITDNPDTSYDNLYNNILQNTQLTGQEVDALLVSKGIKKASTINVPESIIGNIEALKSKNSSLQDIQDFIKFSGYQSTDPEIAKVLKDYSPTKSWWQFWK